MATASASRRNRRLTSSRTASATGMTRMAKSASRGASTSRACGSRLLAPTMLVSMPVVVALAATAATASTKISTAVMTQRSRSTGLRILRSSWSVTLIAPDCGGITGRSFHLVAQPPSHRAPGLW